MNSSFRNVILASTLLALASCADWYEPTMHPDYAIRVEPTADGRGIAKAQPCPNWSENVANPFDNQPHPQFGCATARNLAGMIEKPNDLLEGRTLAPQRGVTAVGAIRRYDNNQPRGLIMPSGETSEVAATTGPNPNSDLTGDVTGGNSKSAGAAIAP